MQTEVLLLSDNNMPTFSPQQMQGMQGGKQPSVRAGVTYTPQQMAQIMSQSSQGKSFDFGALVQPTLSGLNQIGSGFKQVFNAGKNPSALGGMYDLASGGAKVIAGGINTVFSPVSAVAGAAAQIPAGGGQNIGDKINNSIVNPIANKISDSTALQSLMVKYPGLEQDIPNLMTIGLALGGGDKLAQAMKDSIGATGDIGNTISETGGKVIEGVKSLVNPSPEDIANSNIKSLQKIEDNNKTLRTISLNAEGRGIDVKNLVGTTDLLNGSVDENGNISTLKKGEAVDQFNEFMNGYEKTVSDALKREGISIPLTKVEDAMVNTVNDSRVAGGAKTRLLGMIDDEITGLQSDADKNGNISLSKLQDAKITTTSSIDYTKPESKINAKIIGNVYKTLIEGNSNLEVQKLNTELSQFYTIRDYLETLNGKKVLGGRLGKYTAQVVGGLAGSHFGPFGSIIGAEIASKLKGMSMASTFGGETGGNLQATPALQNAAMQSKLPPLALPAPKEGAPQSQNFVPIELQSKIPDEGQAQSLRKNGNTNTNGNNNSEGGNTSINNPAKINQDLSEKVISNKVSQPKVKSSTIPSDLQPLAEEARKYKSAEEFVKAQEIAYHGSPTPLKSFSNKSGVFFTNSMEDASGFGGNPDNVYEGYLKFKNPLVVDAKGAKWNELNTKYGESTQEVISNAQKDGYDGIVFKNIVDNIGDTADFGGQSTISYAYKPKDTFLNESQLTDFYNKVMKSKKK